MAKKRKIIPELNELKEVLGNLVKDIDGRSTHLSYDGNVIKLQQIVEVLTNTYGSPIENHQLLDHIEWRMPDGQRIHVKKASSVESHFSSVCIYIFYVG